MPEAIADLETPCVLIDLDRVEANLRRAQAHADASGYRLRPHIKTHKLPRFARRQMELGAVGITAQKLGEAEVMADAGLTDIFVPTTSSAPASSGGCGAERAGHDERHRRQRGDGRRPCRGRRRGRRGAVDAIAAPGVAACHRRPRRWRWGRRSHARRGWLGGLMTYPPAGKAEAVEAWLARRCGSSAAGIAVPRVTSGNTPDMWRSGPSVVTERRPGTYIYFDRMQVKLGAAGWDDCAISVLATVVSRPTPTRAVLDSGSKSLSSDIMAGLAGYGLVAGTELTLRYLNEEHGVIEAADPIGLRIGERVRVIPNHACVVSNLFDVVHLVSGDAVVASEAVAARGRVD